MIERGKTPKYLRGGVDKSFVAPMKLIAVTKRSRIVDHNSKKPEKQAYRKSNIIEKKQQKKVFNGKEKQTGAQTSQMLREIFAPASSTYL